MLAVTKIEQCPKCGSQNIVKNGFTRHKNQRVLCKDCQKTVVLRRKKTPLIDLKAVARSFLERLSLCGVSRVFAISYYTVYQQLDLACLLLPNFRTQVTDSKQTNYTLEFDELCGFCGSKKIKQWLWAALCKETRQIVAYVIGDRSEKTFRRLVRKIPLAYLRCQSFSNHWKSYRLLCSKGNHEQVGKETGKTNHIERYWATLRARLSRYVRKSLSFSRKLKYHHLVTKLFVCNYNQECINTF
ncbi:MAG: IS1 family transposase [Rudanella sp.]|nr:IS1 family transposase [Rudanella sp.]